MIGDLEIPIVERSIERQGCSIRVVSHAREIISGINVSCPAREELVEGPESTGAQRIIYAIKGEFYRKPLRARNGYEREVVWEYPCPIGNEVLVSRVRDALMKSGRVRHDFIDSGAQH